jgi:hypothetical protein
VENQSKRSSATIATKNSIAIKGAGERASFPKRTLSLKLYETARFIPKKSLPQSQESFFLKPYRDW